MIPAHWKLREWLTISEASQYLSSAIGERLESRQGIGEADVLRLALDGVRAAQEVDQSAARKVDHLRGVYSTWF